MKAAIRGEIKALTGLRFIAALWVVLFHFRPMLTDVSPEFRENLAPVLNCGAQGVDLFFILSGFVLTWNYLDRMGESWSARDTWNSSATFSPVVGIGSTPYCAFSSGLMKRQPMVVSSSEALRL